MMHSSSGMEDEPVFLLWSESITRKLEETKQGYDPGSIEFMG